METTASGSGEVGGGRKLGGEMYGSEGVVREERRCSGGMISGD